MRSMLLFLYALIGLGIGSGINWAADYLPRFASQPPLNKRAGPRPRWSLAVREYLASAFSLNKPSHPESSLLAVGVEIVTTVLFVYIGARWDGAANVLVVAGISIFFVLLATIDLKHRLVLNVLILPAILLVLLVRFISPDANLVAGLLGGAFGFGIFFLVGVLRPGELGAGDVKLATFIGLFFGLPNAIWALLIATLASGVAVIFFLLVRHSSLHRQIPYAPFLCLGALCVFLANPFGFS